MAQFTLPRNSKYSEGKTWPKPAVHTYTMSNDIQYTEPKARMYQGDEYGNISHQ